MAELSGAEILAKSLKTQGVGEMFGLVGLPIGPITVAVQAEGLRYIGVRHEQAAAFAAQAAGYMSGRIGVAAVVSGPGMTNAITALGNAEANCWPMILIGGSSSTDLMERGDFQEAPQLRAAAPFVKWAGQAQDPRLIPHLVATAVRNAISGRPGAVYLDMPGNIIDGTAEEDAVRWAERVPDPPRGKAADDDLAKALETLKSANNPLVVVGKGAAWARAENEVREFIDKTGLPFLPMPMGKGVVPDDHPLNVSAARTTALKNTDVVFLIGARMNWMLHFGLPPRWNENVRVVQLDIEPEEIGTNVPTEAPLVGDAQAIMGQLNAALDAEPWQYEDTNEWKASLNAEVEKKRKQSEEFYKSDDMPMGYYRPLKILDDAMPRDAIFVTEGENTMGIARTVINSYEPRARLDAGTWGTMGVGPGFALAAQALNPGKRVVALEGDAAFGFGPAEVETAVRNELPITWVIFNNNGIGQGVEELDRSKPLPPGVMTPHSHYERIMEAFGGKGYYCTTPDELEAAVKDSFEQVGSTLIHVEIAPRAMRRKQEFGWLTRHK